MLTKATIDQITSLLIQASLTVADIYYEYVNHDIDIDIQKKCDASPVTQADKLLHELISDKLAILTPEVFCLSEESEDEHANRQSIKTLWLLDPVDGTRAFIGKTGEFTINLALVHQESVVASWLVVPMQGELYCSFSDESLLGTGYASNTVYGLSFLQQIPDKYADILLTNQSNLQLTNALSALANKAKPINAHLTDQPTKVLNLGLSRSAQMSDYEGFIGALIECYDCEIKIIQASSAYKFVQMIRGEIDVYVRAYPTCEWDTASGQGLIESIGGQLINFRGHSFLYNVRDTLKNGGFVCFKHIADKNHILKACEQLLEED